MARYKDYNCDRTKMIPLRFADQIQPGTFEYTLSHVVDNDLDLSLFESRYRNDDHGTPAYDPALLLKIVLFGYSRGITSSRKLAQACRENVMFMALLLTTRHKPLYLIAKQLRVKMLGHYRYFAFKGNGQSLWRYHSMVIELLFKWFNRRSQRRSYNWTGYKQLLEVMHLPKPELMDNRRFSITWLYEKGAAVAR